MRNNDLIDLYEQWQRDRDEYTRGQLLADSQAERLARLLSVGWRRRTLSRVAGSN